MLNFSDFFGHSSNNDRIHCVYIQDFFRCEPGWEVAARAVANKACHKLVGVMHYEARLQAIVTYNATFEFSKVTKKRGKKGDADQGTIHEGKYIRLILIFSKIK